MIDLLGYQLREESSLCVRFGDALAPLRWVSAARLGLRWPNKTLPRIGQRASLELPRDGGAIELDAEVEAQMRREGGEELALRLASPSLEKGQALAGLVEDLLRRDLITPSTTHITQREFITDPEALRVFARSAARHKCRGVLRTETGTFRVEAERFMEESGALWWSSLDGPLSGSGSLELIGMASIYVLLHVEARTGAYRLCTPVPSEVLRIRRRGQRRVAVSKGYEIRFTHPLWPNLTIRRPVLDVSFGGASFLTSVRLDLLHPGMRVEDACITTPQGELLRTRAEVRAVTNESDGAHCRVQLTPQSAQDAARWEVLVNRSLYPNTRVGCSWDDAAWDLYEVSGYFSLSGKQPSDFKHLRAAVSEVSRKLDKVPRLGFRAVRPSERGLEAVASNMKYYSGTWLGHQMAKRPGLLPGVPPRRVLREVYVRAHEPIQRDPNARWLLGYLEASVPFTRAVHVEFALRYQRAGQALIMPFHLWEGDVHSLLAEPATLEVGTLAAHETPALLTALATRPAAYQDALDLTPERLDAKEIQRLWRSAGLTRRREFFVARRKGEAIAAAVVEGADHGSNLFHIMESVRIFPLVPLTTEERSAADQALLRTAANWYASHGNQTFVYMQEDDAKPGKLQSLGEGRLWLMSSELLLDWLEHVYLLTD